MVVTGAPDGLVAQILTFVPPAAPMVVPLRAALGALASDISQRAQARGWGQQGFPVVARVLEAMADTELRSENKAAGKE